MKLIDEATIREVTSRLVDEYNPEAIYLFGSYAWGSPNEDSDLDLLIVIDKYKKDRLLTMSDGYETLYDLGICKDILVYDKEQFSRCSKDKTSLCNEIAQKGKMLYAKA